MPRPLIVLVLLFTCCAGCAGGVPFLLPDSRGPADRARAIARRCAGFTEESAAPMLSRAAVDSVEPAYAYVKAGPDDREARLRGARVHVKPLPGLSKEALARNLECHESRVVLGLAPSSDDDPYVLPGAWIDVDADSEGDGFAVQLQVDEIALARRVLERARRFVAVDRK